MINKQARGWKEQRSISSPLASEDGGVSNEENKNIYPCQIPGKVLIHWNLSENLNYFLVWFEEDKTSFFFIFKQYFSSLSEELWMKLKEEVQTLKLK